MRDREAGGQYARTDDRTDTQQSRPDKAHMLFDRVGMYAVIGTLIFVCLCDTKNEYLRATTSARPRSLDFLD